MSTNISYSKENLKLQKWIVLVAFVLFGLKMAAWLLTSSVAIFTDALESTVNIFSALLGLYSLYVAAKPRDEDHPYGHGKVEFISGAVEGVLIMAAGVFILFEAASNLYTPKVLQKMDTGIILVSATAVINFGVGFFAVDRGKKSNSMALLASGKHLMTDSYSTLGLVVALILIYFTGYNWLDPAVALVISGIIAISGYKIVRKSLAGIMDEVDEGLIEKLVASIQACRRPQWVDLHNFRVIKYGHVLHIDCHLTMPWYFDVLEAHDEITHLEQTLRAEYGEHVELFVHVDPCLPSSCSICGFTDCTRRKADLISTVQWTYDNVSKNAKHRLDE